MYHHINLCLCIIHNSLYAWATNNLKSRITFRRFDFDVNEKTLFCFRIEFMIPILLSMQCRLVHIFVVAVVFWMDGRIGCPVLFYTLFCSLFLSPDSFIVYVYWDRMQWCAFGEAVFVRGHFFRKDKTSQKREFSSVDRKSTEIALLISIFCYSLI